VSVVVIDSGELEKLVTRAVERGVTAALKASQPAAFLTIKEAAAESGYTEHALRSLIARETLPASRTANGRVRIERKALEAFMRGERA